MARGTASLGSVTLGQTHFAMAPPAPIQRSKFDRSNGLKTSFAAGYLIPIFVDEALPGDTMSMSMNCFGRLATLLHPVMENMYLDFFFFAVPNRLVWDNWQKMCGEQVNPDDTTDYTVPQMVSPASTGYANLSLSDYLGIPIGIPDLTHSSLWHRGYSLIWNEWFRDQNLQDSVVVDKDNGPDDPADYVLLRRGKRHDYFTSCLPWPQKGTAVELPLGTSAPVTAPITASGTWKFTDGTTIDGISANTGTAPVSYEMNDSAMSRDTDLSYSSGLTISGATADLSTATAATIGQIREAFQLQKMFERDARGGTRYIEMIRSHFGVISSDQRLQRPEFLGGGTVRVNVNPVATTSHSAAYPRATLSAFGTAAGRVGFFKSFEEHCLLLGLVMLRADLTYQQGLERMFSRSTRFDYYWPSLANLGEQAVLNKEIYAQGSLDTTDDDVFGYQERYAEYRYKPSRVTGQMRSGVTDTLEFYHLAQDFSGLPVLDETFIQENPEFNRIVASTSPQDPDMVLDCWFSYSCTRPMPTYAVPGLIDHF